MGTGGASVGGHAQVSDDSRSGSGNGSSDNGSSSSDSSNASVDRGSSDDMLAELLGYPEVPPPLERLVGGTYVQYGGVLDTEGERDRENWTNSIRTTKVL